MIDRTPQWLWICVVWLVSGALFYGYHTLPGDLLGVDAYFHLRISAVIAESGLVRDLMWLPYTIYSPVFVDDHLLFHLLLIPFLGSDPVSGGQLYASVIAGATFAVFYGILATHRIRWPGVWTACLFTASTAYLFRLSLVRAPSLSLLCLLVGCWILLVGRDRWLAPLGFLYAWSYGGFPLLIVQAGVAAIAFVVLGTQRWRAAGWAIGGCLAGLIINPYFPDNLAFLWTSYTEIELGTFPQSIIAGNEDYPFAASTAIRKAWMVWVLTFVVIVAYLVRPIQMTGASFFLFLFSIALLCLYLLARRFIEYWPPFAFLAAAFALQHWWSAAPSRWRDTLHTCLWVIVPVTVGLSGYSVATALTEIRGTGQQLSAYTGACEFISRTASRNDIIFHSSWGDFPVLVYLNPGHRYIAGLGMHYLYLKDADLHETYVDICDGKLDRPVRTIRDTFGATYAFARATHTPFLRSMDQDPMAKRVYEDEYTVVFKLAGSVDLP